MRAYDERGLHNLGLAVLKSAAEDLEKAYKRRMRLERMKPRKHSAGYLEAMKAEEERKIEQLESWLRTEGGLWVGRLGYSEPGEAIIRTCRRATGYEHENR